MFVSKKRVRQLLRQEKAPISLENLLTLAVIIVVSLISIRLIGGSTHDKLHSASKAIAPDQPFERN